MVNKESVSPVSEAGSLGRVGGGLGIASCGVIKILPNRYTFDPAFASQAYRYSIIQKGGFSTTFVITDPSDGVTHHCRIKRGLFGEKTGIRGHGVWASLFAETKFAIVNQICDETYAVEGRLEEGSPSLSGMFYWGFDHFFTISVKERSIGRVSLDPAGQYVAILDTLAYRVVIRTLVRGSPVNGWEFMQDDTLVAVFGLRHDGFFADSYDLYVTPSERGNLGQLITLFIVLTESSRLARALDLKSGEQGLP